ncbi:hypothetical protein [Pontibacter harenae]|uniref:hypothetical protein n=1 Tax=Pontibacter harenae TaxID=2894083 RepID=UPI001E63B87A|nr:hypothetical protein [Pontibacter harenae]MCC9165448.1 hypothetical protein [Pontibacter harenae]
MKSREIYWTLSSLVVIMLVAIATCMAATSVSLSPSNQPQQQVTLAGEASTNEPKAKSTATTTKPSQKSILDADVLESPMSFLKSAFSEEEDSAESFDHASALVVALKALVATLLSTII